MLLLIAIKEKCGTSGCTCIPSSFTFHHVWQQKFYFFQKWPKLGTWQKLGTLLVPVQLFLIIIWLQFVLSPATTKTPPSFSIPFFSNFSWIIRIFYVGVVFLCVIKTPHVAVAIAPKWAYPRWEAVKHGKWHNFFSRYAVIIARA